MTHRDLNLDHWPPTLSDIADGFALIEKVGDRVVTLDLAQVPLSVYGDEIDDEAGALWGAKLHPGSNNYILKLTGEHGTFATLRGPLAGPPTGPIHVPFVFVHAPCVPTEGELATQQRFLDHHTDDDFIVTPREYASIRKFARDLVDIETSHDLLKQGVMGYKNWTDDDGVSHRATIRIRRS